LKLSKSIRTSISQLFLPHTSQLTSNSVSVSYERLQHKPIAYIQIVFRQRQSFGFMYFKWRTCWHNSVWYDS